MGPKEAQEGPKEVQERPRGLKCSRRGVQVQWGGWRGFGRVQEGTQVEYHWVKGSSNSVRDPRGFKDVKEGSKHVLGGLSSSFVSLWVYSSRIID